MIFPRVRAGSDGDETVAAVFVGKGASFTGEIRVERRIVLIVLVKIPAGGVGLPDFDECVADGTTIFIRNAAADCDAFAEGFTIVLAR